MNVDKYINKKYGAITAVIVAVGLMAIGFFDLFYQLSLLLYIYCIVAFALASLLTAVFTRSLEASSVPFICLMLVAAHPLVNGNLETFYRTLYVAGLILTLAISSRCRVRNWPSGVAVPVLMMKVLDCSVPEPYDSGVAAIVVSVFVMMSMAIPVVKSLKSTENPLHF